GPAVRRARRQRGVSAAGNSGAVDAGAEPRRSVPRRGRVSLRAASAPLLRLDQDRRTRRAELPRRTRSAEGRRGCAALGRRSALGRCRLAASRLLEQHEREPIFFVRVVRDRIETEAAELGLQLLGVELAADLYQDPFPFMPRELDFAPRNANLLRLRRNRVHLDALPLRVIPWLVTHLGLIEVAPQDSIDVFEDVQDERGGDFLGVVVGFFEQVYVFYAVHS